MSNFTFTKDIPDANETLDLYKKTEFYNEFWSPERMEKVLENSSLLLCCYDNKKLVGILRGITDTYWIAHISHLAVHPDYQGQGIGKSLILKTKDELGKGVTLMVHAGPGVDGYYKSIGFEVYDNVYRIKRTK